MRIKAMRPVQLAGHICSKGEVRDWDGAIDARIAANFTAEDGTPLGEVAAKDAGAPAAGDGGPSDLDKISRTVATLKRQGICQQLDGMNITYSPGSRTEHLAKLLLMSKGEIEG